MPLSYFEPIVGSSFDALAAQRAGWAGFNANVEQANLARLAAAQQAQNQWLQNASIMRNESQRFGLGLQEASDRSRMASALRQAETAEAARQFGINTTLAREQMDLNRDLAHKKIEAEGFERQRALSAIESAGNFLAPEIQSTGAAYDTALQAYDQANTAFNSVLGEQQSKLPAGRWDKPSQTFISRLGDTPETIKLVQEANNAISAARSALDSASLTLQTHATSFDTLRRDASGSGLKPGKRNGRWVLFSPDLNKTFGEMVEQARREVEPVTPPAAPTPSGTTWFTDLSQPIPGGVQSWSGLGQAEPPQANLNLVPEWPVQEQREAVPVRVSSIRRVETQPVIRVGEYELTAE